MGKIDFRHNMWRDMGGAIRKIMGTKMRKKEFKGTQRQRIKL